MTTARRAAAAILTGLVVLSASNVLLTRDSPSTPQSARQDIRDAGEALDAHRPDAGVYAPLRAPVPILDTRNGLGETAATPVPARSSIAVHIGGRGAPQPNDVGSLLGTLTVYRPASSGDLLAYSGARPSTASLMFTRGRTAATTILVTVVAGRFTLANDSLSPVDVTLDAVGFFGAGPVPADPGLFHPIVPVRAVDTRTGAGGNRHTPLRDGDEFAAHVTGQGAVPSTHVGAVAITVHAISPTSGGSLSLWSPDTSRPPLAVAHYAAGQDSSTFDIVALGAASSIEIYAANTGHLDVAIDVVGYFGYGATAAAGGYQAATTASQISGPHEIRSNAQTQISSLGRTAVPRGHVSAVVVAVQAFRSEDPGRLSIYAAGGKKPSSPIGLTFTRNVPASGVFVVPVSRDGRFVLTDASHGPVVESVSLLGYLPANTVHAPRVSVGRYIRNLTGNVPYDRAVMAREGAADGRRRDRLVLLAIGAATNNRSGVVLSITHTSITWATLVQALDSYLSAYAEHSGRAAVKIVLATSNSGNNWSHYTARERGVDWADRVVNAVDVPTHSHISVVAGVDFEAGFTSTEAQAQQWENAYLGATTSDLVYTGDATDCPIVFSRADGPCQFGWTQTQIYALAHQAERITVLPQIYAPDDALKWANIDAVGGGKLIFDGALTEHTADPARSQEPDHGWTALYRALSWLTTTPQLPSVIDLARNKR